jgi:hypothetical protein
MNCMNNSNRDILILSKYSHWGEETLALEVASLHKIFYEMESSLNFCIANEVIDVNRYRIIRKPLLVQQAIKERGNKPFIFICCKN